MKKVTKRAVSVILLAAMALSLIGCGDADNTARIAYWAIDSGTFLQGLYDIGIKDDEYMEDENGSAYGWHSTETYDYDTFIHAWRDDVYFYYYDFESERTASEFFQEIYEPFEYLEKHNMVEVDELDLWIMQGGAYSGYIVVDGDMDGLYTYGAFYQDDDTLVMAFTYSDREKGKDLIDDFFKAINFTYPWQWVHSDHRISSQGKKPTEETTKPGFPF